MLKLFNTLTRKKETFKPLKDKKAGLYSCGPTVYWYAHIGNLRAYLFSDLLKRVLEYNDYKVKHVMNLTDVGHLTSDEDTGEDKMEKSSKREKKTALEIAEFYTKHFKKDLKNLNIIEPTVWIKATETIKEQIELIEILEKKGFTYKTEDGVYFDTSKLDNYGILWGNKIDLEAGKRVCMKEKKNPTDFALWKFSKTKRQMEWDSPWGIGFPGWHTECVVMSSKELGIPFDIHTGGIDHIQVHHTNEIAQTKGAYNKKLANFWMHNDFILLKKGKMSKSKGEILTLDKLIEKGFDPLSYRYLCLTCHYKSKLNFSFSSLKQAQTAYFNLKEKLSDLKDSKGEKGESYKKEFLKYINDDLDTPKALALIWKLINDKKVSDKGKHSLILDFDKVLGLNLKEKNKIPKEIIELAEERQKHRKQKDFQKADEVRKSIENKGYEIEDLKQGYEIRKSAS